MVQSVVSSRYARNGAVCPLVANGSLRTSPRADVSAALKQCDMNRLGLLLAGRSGNAYVCQAALFEPELRHFIGRRFDEDMGVEGAVQGRVKVGDSAPDFVLPNQSGEMVSLKDMIGKKIIVLYFYPRDFSLGCTAEACAFRDSYEVFKEAGAEVVGVSSQSVDSHKRFASTNALPFILLSDEDGKVRKLYGASSAFGLMPGRVTYVIDKKGIVRHVFSSQLNPTEHIEEALRIIKDIGKD